MHGTTSFSVKYSFKSMWGKKKSDQGSFLNFDDSPKILLDVTKKNL